MFMFPEYAKIFIRSLFKCWPEHNVGTTNIWFDRFCEVFDISNVQTVFAFAYVRMWRRSFAYAIHTLITIAKPLLFCAKFTAFTSYSNTCAVLEMLSIASRCLRFIENGILLIFWYPFCHPRLFISQLSSELKHLKQHPISRSVYALFWHLFPWHFSSPSILTFVQFLSLASNNNIQHCTH